MSSLDSDARRERRPRRNYGQAWWAITSAIPIGVVTVMMAFDGLWGVVAVGLLFFVFCLYDIERKSRPDA